MGGKSIISCNVPHLLPVSRAEARGYERICKIKKKKVKFPVILSVEAIKTCIGRHDKNG